MTINFRKTSVSNGEIRYADPSDVTHTLRVVVSTAPKTAGAVSLTNNRLEYIESIHAPVTDGTNTAKEVVSIRIVASGSTLNEVLIKAAVTQAFANYTAVMNDKGLQGFTPEIALVANPAS